VQLSGGREIGERQEAEDRQERKIPKAKIQSSNQIQKTKRGFSREGREEFFTAEAQRR
jgi:hypothetical protein